MNLARTLESTIGQIGTSERTDHALDRHAVALERSRIVLQALHALLSLPADLEVGCDEWHMRRHLTSAFESLSVKPFEAALDFTTRALIDRDGEEREPKDPKLLYARVRLQQSRTC